MEGEKKEERGEKQKHEGKSGCERPLSINYPPTLSLTAGTSGFSRKLNQNRSPLEPGLNIGPSENPRRENMETAFAERLQELSSKSKSQVPNFNQGCSFREISKPYLFRNVFTFF